MYARTHLYIGISIQYKLYIRYKGTCTQVESKLKYMKTTRGVPKVLHTDY